MIIFAAQDILTSSHCKLGHLLLRCVRYYVELDIYTSLEVHTEDTIAAGKLALQKFSEIMGVSHCFFSQMSLTMIARHFTRNTLPNRNPKPSKIGTFPRSTWSRTYSTIFWPKAWHATTIQSQMKRCMVLCEKSTSSALILRMLLLRFTTYNYRVNLG